MPRLFKILKNPERLLEVRDARTATPEWKHLLGAYIGLASLPFSITLASGRFEFQEKSDVATFWQVFFRHVYPLRPSDRLVVDAGGNIGAFSLYALLKLPDCQVVAIEPSSSSFERLQHVLRAHGVEARCTCIRAALGDVDGATTITPGLRETGCASTDSADCTRDPPDHRRSSPLAGTQRTVELSWFLRDE
jgi:FkbM family methyltransferase